MIINYLARRPWGQKLLFPVVVAACAYSWADTATGTKNEQDAGRLKFWWGWCSPAMAEHWKRLGDPSHPDYGSLYHSTKNVGSEYARTDVQRVFKAMSFAIVAALILSGLAAIGWLV